MKKITKSAMQRHQDLSDNRVDLFLLIYVRQALQYFLAVCGNILKIFMRRRKSSCIVPVCIRPRLNGTRSIQLSLMIAALCTYILTSTSWLVTPVPSFHNVRQGDYSFALYCVAIRTWNCHRCETCISERSDKVVMQNETYESNPRHVSYRNPQ